MHNVVVMVCTVLATCVKIAKLCLGIMLEVIVILLRCVLSLGVKGLTKCVIDEVLLIFTQFVLKMLIQLRQSAFKKKKKLLFCIYNKIVDTLI